MFNNILVVCIGNICRSPMGEALLRAQAPAGAHVHSAGLGALVDQPADPFAVQLMAERGIDISAHRARQLTAEMARRADLILVMEQIHRRHLSGLAPAAFGKVRLLDEPRDIPDPYRQPLAAFRAALAQIERGADAWSARLWRQ